MGVAYPFTATVGPLTASVPITYARQVSDQAPLVSATQHVLIQSGYALVTATLPVAARPVTAAPAPNCGALYLHGTVVALTATGSGDFVFANWSGAAAGASNPITDSPFLQCLGYLGQPAALGVGG